MVALHRPSIRTAVRSITLLAALTALLLTMLTPFVGTASAQLLPGASFDALDADLDTDPGIVQLPDPCPRIDDADHNGPDDGPINGSTTKLNVIHDDAPPTINPDSSHPGHSDLCNIWMGSEIVDGTFLLYLAWEREAAGGSSGAYWEFQQASLACLTDAPDCNPFANRQVGDFIVHFDFQGNSLDDISIRTFDGATFGPPANPADVLPSPAGEASVRGDKLFGEAVLNLTGLGILDPAAGTCESFAGVIPGSATGNSDKSDYKDIVLTGQQPGISNCGDVVVEKVSSTGDDYGDVFPITLSDDGGTVHSEDLGHGGSFTEQDLFAGTDYDVTEAVPANWSLDGIACQLEDGTPTGTNGTDFEVIAGETTTCTVTNTPDLPTVTLEKTVVNDDGGTLAKGDFPSFLDGNPLAWDTTIDIAVGPHTASETQQTGYTTNGWGGDCATDGTFTAALGQDYVCTITNDDVPSGLTIVKVVVNDDGGALQATNFPLMYTPLGGAPVTVQNQVTTPVPAGTYTIGEVQQSGYELTGITCDNGVSSGPNDTTVDVTVANDESVVCTITNDDDAPTVTLEKTVVNDDGGTLAKGDFPSFLDGNPLAWDTTLDIAVGAHTASETQQTGYTTNGWGGDCATDGTFTAALGQDYVCTITNDDVAPAAGPGPTVVQDDPGTLVLTKVVANDDGGTATQDAFAPTIDGDAATWGDNTVDGDTTYTIGEVDADGSTLLADGEYRTASIVCDGELTDQIRVPDGETRECVITNQDVPAGLTVVKQVVNDDGGSAEPSDFTLLVTPDDGDVVEVTSGQQTFVEAGTYTVSEQQLPGYALASVSCDNGETTTDAAMSVTVGLDERVTCTLVNDDLPIGIQLTKVADTDAIVFQAGGDDEVVTYSYTVTNTGDVALDGLRLVDDVLGGVALPVGELAPNQTVVATAEHVVTQADAEAGTIVNVATVEGSAADGRTAGDTADEQVAVDEVEVLPIVVTRPEPEPAPAPTLPATGSETLRLALWAALVAGLGTVLLLGTDDARTAGRRRG